MNEFLFGFLSRPEVIERNTVKKKKKYTDPTTSG